MNETYPEAPDDAQRAVAEIQQFLIEELALRIEVLPELIDPGQPFERYGLDSLSAIRLSVELEETLGRKLPTTMLWDYPSIESVAHYLAFELNVREIRPETT